MNEMSDIRWKQRFENFERAFILLREALSKEVETLSDLEKEGVIQRFEYTLELAWKTLKDYLEFSNVVLDQITPRKVIKEAFAANIIQDGETWIKMLELRNHLSHKYDQNMFNQAIDKIAKIYLDKFDEMFMFLKEKAID